MLMFSEREREQGVELDIRSIKAALMAYADKEFYDWQADKNAPKVGAVLGPAISPNPGKVAKQMAKAATKAAVAAAALSAGAATAAVIQVPWPTLLLSKRKIARLTYFLELAISLMVGV